MDGQIDRLSVDILGEISFLKFKLKDETEFVFVFVSNFPEAT